VPSLARPHLTFGAPTRSRIALIIGVIAVVLAVATVVVAILESSPIGLLDASPVYFVAVVVAGSLFGTVTALATAIASFVLYDLLFTNPHLTLVVSDPKELLDLILFLVLAVVVGRLSALGTERAAEASRRAAESSALFAISRILATAPDSETAAPQVAELLVRDAALDRVWIVNERGQRSRVVADTGGGKALPGSSIVTALVRSPGETPAHWVRAHEPHAPETKRSADCFSGGGSEPTIIPATNATSARITRGKARVTRRRRRSTSGGSDFTGSEKLVTGVTTFMQTG
jgi:K+-sensing histidine kinase KdpD